MKLPLWTIWTCAAALAATLSFGCSGTHNPSERIIIALDRSGSTYPFREQQLDLVDKASGYAEAHDRELELWSYDSVARRVYGPQLPRESEILAVKWDDLITRPGALHPGTRPAKLLQGINRDLATPNSAGRVRIGLITDGDNDYMGDTPRLRRELATLAAMPDVRLALIDVQPNNDAYWQKLLEATMPGRYKIADASDATATLAWLVRK